MAIKGQAITITYTVWDTDTATPLTGDVNNHTCRITKDGGVLATATNTPSELGYGVYAITLTATETNCNSLTLQVSSSTSDVAIPPVQITFNPTATAPSANDVATAVWGYSSGRTITNTIPSTAQIALAVWSYEDDNNLYYPYRTIKGIEYDNYSIYQPYGPGHDVALSESIWGYDPSALVSNTTAGKRLIDIQNNAARPGDAMTLTAAYNAAKTASQFNASTDTVTINSVQAATMVTATGFATPSDLSGLSTFNAATDRVLIDSTQAATMTTATGFATPSDLTGLSTFDPATDRVLIDATQAATMTTATGFATPSDLAGLSTFDPSTDTVLIDSTQAATMTTATGFATPSDLVGLSTFDPSTDRVLLDATQAATMTTATGFATPANITVAVTEIETHGDSNWRGGGATAQQVWEYQGGRTITASPTDISSLATKTDLSNAQTAIVNAMPSTTGLATATNVSDAKADIIAAIPDISGLSTFNPTTDTVLIDATQVADFATSSDITTAQEAIISAVEGIDLSGLATSTDTAVLNAELQEILGGVMNWYVTANTLTVYSPSNTVIRTYSITRDPEGNITRIQPNN